MEFGAAYINFRDQTISDLYPLKVKESKIEFNNLHFCLVNGNPISAASIGKNEYEIIYDTETLLKSLLGDIELYRAKVWIQKETILNSKAQNAPCWNYITNYYYSFYNAVLLTRFIKNGYMYFDDEKSNKLSKIIEALSGDLTQINSGNFEFKIRNLNNSTSVLHLKKTGVRSHVAIWSKVNEVIKTLKNKSIKGAVEETTYKGLLAFNKKPTFHSDLRNAINYKPIYALESLNKTIFENNFINIEDKEIVKEIIKKTTEIESEHIKQKKSSLLGECIH